VTRALGGQELRAEEKDKNVWIGEKLIKIEVKLAP